MIKSDVSLHKSWIFTNIAKRKKEIHMDRRDFLKVSSVSLMAMGTDDVTAKMFEPSGEKKEKMVVRFLGTGAADWNGIDNRGEHRRLSSILVDNNILFDFTAGNIEMLPANRNRK